VPDRALALAYRAQLLLARGTPGAGPLADSALRLARRSNSARIEGIAYNVLGREQLRVRRADSAEVLFGRAVRLLKDAGDLIGYAGALQWRGYLLRSRGELGAAERDLRAGLAVGKVAGLLTLGWTEVNLGQVAMSLNDWPEARRHLAASRALFDSTGDRGTASAMQAESASGGPCVLGRADSLLRERAPARAIRQHVGGPRHARPAAAVCTRRRDGRVTETLALARDTTMRGAPARTSTSATTSLLALGTGRLTTPARRSTSRSAKRAFERTDVPAAHRRAEAEAQLGRLDSAEATLRSAMTRFERYRATRGRASSASRR
jgi:tetratricopeptide (TPR) repeat protein